MQTEKSYWELCRPEAYEADLTGPFLFFVQATTKAKQRSITKEKSGPRLPLPLFKGGLALFLFAVSFFSIYNFAKKPDALDRKKAQLQTLEQKIKQGTALTVSEKEEYCELLWIIKKIALENCENLTNAQYQDFVNVEKTERFPDHKVLSRKLAIDESDFENFKKDELIPVYKALRLKPAIHKRAVKDVKNPDIGFWGDDYLVFRPSKQNANEKISVYTFRKLSSPADTAAISEPSNPNDSIQ